MLDKKILEKLLVPVGKKIRLRDYETGWAQTKELRASGREATKERAEELLRENLKSLADAQELLYADDRYALLIILQAMDAAGKDGTIKHVMSGVNPQGCQVFSFKRPSDEELDHTFLWRCMRCLPERGRIGIFNRSYYEEVLVVKVHPEFLDRQKLPDGKRDKAFWDARYDDINQFERHLTRNGTRILKLMLNVSKSKQKERFLERLDTPDKHWKFSAADVGEREYWDQYMQAYEAALSATSTDWAPWYVIPADDKWATRTIVAELITRTIGEMDLRYPPLSPAQKNEIEAARLKLGVK